MMNQNIPTPVVSWHVIRLPTAKSFGYVRINYIMRTVLILAIMVCMVTIQNITLQRGGIVNP